MSEAIKVGDFVRIREDATTEGQPFGELFLKLTWRVVALRDDLVEIASKYLKTELKLHTFTRKLRHATPEEMPS